jgi:hypothetical protein
LPDPPNGYHQLIDRAVVSPLPAERPHAGRSLRVAVRPHLAPVLVLSGIVLGAAALAASYAARTTSWAVMTDELQVARLAVSIAETLSPVPTIHGAYYGAHSQLYPLLLAPFYGSLSAPAAATAAHALNGLLLASAAVPTYLLARSVTGSRAAGYAAAAFAAFTPWLALSATLLTENAAYPAFAWAVLLCHRALAEPSPHRDAYALAGLLLAFLARTQLVVLALALPLALVLHELGLSLREGKTTREALRTAVANHRLLAGAYLAGALFAVVLALGGSLGGIVGNYAVPFEGDLVPDGFWASAAAHFDQIAVGVGILPVLLAASWVATTAIRPAAREAHALAAIVAVLVPALTFQVTSFDLRFTPEQFIQERYLLYVVPLVAIGAAAWLARTTDLRLRLATLGAATAAFVGLLAFASYDLETLIYWTSPAAAFYPEIMWAAEAVGLSGTTLLQIAAAVLAGLVALCAWRAPRLALASTAVVVSAFGVAQAAYVLDRYVGPTTSEREALAARDWIDEAVPGSPSVALVPGGPDGPTVWWEAEHWNKDVDRVLRIDSGPTHSPFPTDEVSIDLERGELAGSRPSDYVVVSTREARFRLRAREVAAARRLTLLRVNGPYRLDWATRGLTADGWTLPRRLALVRLFGAGKAQSRIVTLTLAASRFAPRPAYFSLRNGGNVVSGWVYPGGARPPVDISVCVPERGYADVLLTTNGRTRLPDGRAVAVHVERMTVRPVGDCGGSPRME